MRVAPNVKEFSSIFADRPENIRDAFVSAVEDLETAISGLSEMLKRIKYFVKVNAL